LNLIPLRRLSPRLSLRAPKTRLANVAAFDSDVLELDIWLKRRALQNGASGASRSDVVSAGDRVVGYYALATGAVAQQEATGKVRRNMPEPIPVMMIGRLAVDREYQGKGLGSALLKDALLRTLNAASIAGIRAVCSTLSPTMRSASTRRLDSRPLLSIRSP
jgi:GNAT superfamily N-acetyltransferase